MNVKEDITKIDDVYTTIFKNNEENNQLTTYTSLNKWIRAWEYVVGANTILDLAEVIWDIHPALTSNFRDGFNKIELYYVLCGYYKAKGRL